jgi:uncharacterized protein (DUF433 family)
MTLPEYITKDADGFLHVAGHRIGLQDVVDFYNEGFSPEMLLGQYPTLSLPLLNSVIAFYLENRDEIDAYIAGCNQEIGRQRAAASPGPDTAELRRRFEAVSRAEGA